MPVLTLIASVVVLNWERLDSERPPSPGVAPEQPTNQQNVSARLWQDPLSVARASLKPGNEHKAAPAATATAESEDVGVSANYTMLVPVIMLGGAYGQDVEFRARTRFAVWTALWSLGWVPADGDHIGVYEWETMGSKQAVAFEWAGWLDNAGHRALIVWVSESSLGPHPLSDLSRLLQATTQSSVIGEPLHVSKTVVLHCGGSGTLANVASEVLAGFHPLQGDPLHAASVEITTATTDDRALLRSKWTEERPALYNPVFGFGDDPFELVELLNQQRGDRRGDLAFHRSIVSDGAMMHALVEELSARSIKFGDFVAHDASTEVASALPDPGRIVLISELDTSYGRNLPVAFAKAAIERGNADLDHAGGSRPDRRPLPDNATIRDLAPWSPLTRRWLDIYAYARGFDGRLHDDAPGSKSGPAKADAKNDGSALMPVVPAEAAEGLNQADYLRRLALEIEAKDRELRAHHANGGIRAVGIMGSDVYDKLMILKALRPRLPGTLFFTTDLDARLTNPSDWNVTRNLLIAAPYGLQLVTDSLNAPNHGIPPFRDSYQTAVYAGAMRALNAAIPGSLPPEALPAEELPPVQLYEVGRNGPVWLQTAAKAVAPTTGANPFLRTTLNWKLGLWLFCLFGIALGCWAMHAGVESVGTSRWWHQLGRALIPDTIRWLGLATIFSYLLTVLLADWDRAVCAFAEPFAIVEGVSIWPTFMLRCVGTLMALYFIVDIRRMHEVSQHSIAHKFNLDSHSTVPAGAQSEITKKASDEGGTDPRGVWRRHCAHGRLGWTATRVTCLALLYLIGNGALFVWLGFPASPARGGFAQLADLISLGCWVVSQVAISMLVLDAFLQMVALIRHFDHGRSDWTIVTAGQPPGTHLCADSVAPKLDAAVRAELLDLRLIAERTRDVGRIFVFPFIVQVFGIAARSSLIDNWTWPLPLLIVVSLNLLLICVSIGLVTQAATKARASSIGTLQQLRAKTRSTSQREAIDAAITRVRGESTGAFAPITQQPAVRYALWLMSGLGAGSIFGFIRGW